MTQHVSNAAVWDAYLPSWLRGSWGPAAEIQTAAGPGRVASRGSDKQRREQSAEEADRSCRGDGDVRTNQEGRRVTEDVPVPKRSQGRSSQPLKKTSVEETLD